MIPGPPPVLAVLNRRVANGVWTIDDVPAGAASLAAGHGWFPISITVDSSTDKATLLRSLGDAGDFPDHYGANWDAAADLLADLSWLDASGPNPVVILLAGAETWAASNERDASVLLDVLEEAALWWQVHGRPFVVLWEGRRTPLPCLDLV